MLSCGRVRNHIESGLNNLVDGQLENLRVSILKLASHETFNLDADSSERCIVLINGTCEVSWDQDDFILGPRLNPFDGLPSALFIPRGIPIIFHASEPSMLGIGSAPAKLKGLVTKIRPEDIHVARRGDDNWSRTVRQICWSDNTNGEMLLAAETCTPSGNWSTIPPHRHQFLRPGEEVPYEEAYFFQFSKPDGFGLTWQFDDDGDLDQSFSLKNNDLIYMNGGYHPIACAPGSMLYHLSFMSGPERISRAKVHPAYQFLLDEHQLKNQYTPDT